jgi:acyl-CoA synthetase (AMP-forming)/AMP-acid ligase II
MADKRPNHIAVRSEGEDISYSEFLESSNCLAVGFTRAGVCISDRVMMFAENTVEHLLVYHAVAQIGAIFCPVNAGSKVRELSYAITNSRPKLIIVSSTLAKILQASLQDAKYHCEMVVLDAAEEEAGRRCLNHIRHAADGWSAREVAPEHPLLICYTSGTTSLPKPVLRSHGAESWSAAGYRDGWGFEPEDRMLVALPLSWVYGLCSLSQTLFTSGATVVLQRRFSPTRTLEQLSSREATSFAGSMSMYAMMLKVMQEREFEFSGHYRLNLGGEPRNEVVVAEIEKRFGHRLLEAWAMSETFPVMTVHPERDMAAPKGSLGKVVPGMEVRLVDEAGNDVPDSTAGEALVRGSGDFLEYYREPCLTAERRDAQGWIRSGDLLSRDTNGYYTFVTRRSELIIRGGTNISPAEIESAICAHPAISDAVVVGLPDDVLGEQVVALVKLANNAPFDPETVMQMLEKSIARFKLPSAIYAVDAITFGATGKKDRASAKTVAAQLHHKSA